ncbi:MAG: coxL, partial [Chloroflexi bacterium]|nr:coxL [Chloroflexota bacterium]
MLTVLVQMIAQELQLPIEKISVTVMNTEAELWDRGSSAVSVTNVAGHATLKAVDQARQKLNATACEYLGCPPDEVTLVDGFFRDPDGIAPPMPFADVAARACEGGQPVTGHCRYDSWERNYAASFVAQVAEVEVDPRSGKVTVRRIASAADAGIVLNPNGAGGQIEGATIIGLGGATMEELRIADGRVLNPGLREYKLPTMGDLPEMTNTFIEQGGGPSPYGAKTVADLGLLVASAAIANAISDAVGVRFDELPITAEKVYRALQARGGG